MKTYTARDAKNRLGEVLRAALSEPVVITVHGRPSVQLTSVERDPETHSHQVLDTIKQKISCEVLARFSINEIKRRSVNNIERWRANGTFGPAYADWLEILNDPDDAKLIAAMVGNSERSNQLRQSIPFTGMLDQEVVRKLNEEVRG